MGKGSNTTTNNTTSSADPQAAQAYRDLIARAQGVASTPYQAYTGDLTAPVHSQQQQGIAGINGSANFASPYIQQASQQAGAATAPITGSTIQQYQNPYTQQVIDATNSQMTHDNASQMAALQGNQIAQGALGGNATGVAKGILAGQQGRTMASTDAGLYQQSYNQALQAAQQQQQTGLAGANAQANYGVAGQNAALTGATAQIGAGTLEQQTSQNNLNALYQQYAQAQAYPYQQTQWLSGIATGVGSNLGGTSSGSTTGPAPNQTGQYLGAGLAAAGLFLNRGGAVNGVARYADGGGVGDFEQSSGSPYQIRTNGGQHQVINIQTGQVHYTGTASGAANAQATLNSRRYASGGGVSGYADGGVPTQPWGGATGWIPQMNIHGGSGAPHGSAPSLPSQQGSQVDPVKMAQGIIGVGNKLSGPAYGGGSFFGGDAYGGSSSSPLEGLSAADYGPGFADGGAVSPRPYGIAGYAGGGDIEDLRHGDPAWMEGIPDENRSIGESLLRQGVGTRSLGDAPQADAPVFGPDGRMMGNQTSAQGVAPAPADPVVAEDDDDDAAPVGIAGRAGGAGRPPVMASDADPYYAAPDAVSPPEKSGFGLGLVSPNAKTGLLAAGIGMLASRSPFLGNMVGEGGIAGVGAYGAANEHDRKVAEEAAKLSREANEKQRNFGLNVRKQDETERHNVVTEKNARATADRTKFVPAGQYMGEDGIYRPVVMDQSTGRLVDPATGNAPPSGANIKGKGDTGFTDDEAKDIARRFVVSGDVTDMQGIGPAARLKVTRAIRQVQKDLNVSDEELAQRKVEFAGRKAGSRTLGTMEAKMGSAAFEAEGAIKLVRGVIEKLPRTSFLPFNQLAEAYSKKTLNPDQAELYARAQAIVNTYSAVMSRGANVVTDSARHHAGDLLNTAYDSTTFNRVLDTMLNEIEMAKASPARMQEFYRKHYGPKSVEAGTGSAGAPPPSATGGFKPPAGALPGKPDANGKVWYYDPASHQPYPGQ